MNQQAFLSPSARVAPKRNRFKQYVMLIAAAAALVVVMLVIVGTHRNLYQLGYAVVEQSNENTILREKQDRLKAELARLTAPDRVIAESVRLGLRPLAATGRVEVHFAPASEPKPLQGSSPAMLAMMEEMR